MTYSDTQVLILNVTTRVSSILGLLGSIAVLAAYFFSQKFRKSVISRICVAISLGDFISIGAQLLGRLGPDAGPNSFICQAQGFLQLFGEIAAALLIPCVTLNLLLVVRNKATLSDIKSYDAFYIPSSFAIAGLISVIPLWLMDVGKKSAFGNDFATWCFLTRNAKHLMWALYGPIIFSFFFNFVTFVLVKVQERKKIKENSLFRGFSVDDPMLDLLPGIIAVYVVVFSLTWIPMMTVFIYKQFDPTLSIYFLSLLNSIFLPLRGLTDGLVAFYQAWRSSNPIVKKGRGKRLDSF